MQPTLYTARCDWPDIHNEQISADSASQHETLLNSIKLKSFNHFSCLSSKNTQHAQITASQMTIMFSVLYQCKLNTLDTEQGRSL